MPLQGIQSFTEACARLDLDSQRDSLLRNLNHLCISVDDADVLSDDGSTTSGAHVILDSRCQESEVAGVYKSLLDVCTTALGDMLVKCLQG